MMFQKSHLLLWVPLALREAQNFGPTPGKGAGPRMDRAGAAYLVERLALFAVMNAMIAGICASIACHSWA